MRLLFVTQDFPPEVGGIQTYSWELARRLASVVEALEVIAPTHPESADLDRTVAFPVRRVPGRSDLLPLTALPAVPVHARRLRADIAFHAQWQTVGASALARALTGWPHRIVCAAHGRELLFNPLSNLPALGPGYDRMRRFLLGQVEALLPVSHYTAGLLETLGASSDRLHVVPNGTDPERFQPQDPAPLRQRLGLEDRALLLTVGRLVPRKGIDTVLRALPALARRVPRLMYLVAGTGPDRPRLERLARTLGVADRVRFLGQIPNEQLPQYYSAADVFVMPAREAPPDVEGFGLVFLEANACGTPVIGARSGGIPDAIQHGTTGLLVPPSDAEALADAAARLLTDPERAERLGRQGRHRAQHEASWDHIAQRIHALLKEIAR